MKYLYILKLHLTWILFFCFTSDGFGITASRHLFSKNSLTIKLQSLQNEDPEITRQIKKIIIDASNRTMKEEDYCKSFWPSLDTSQKEIQADLKKMGTLVSLNFVKKEEESLISVYYYTILFKNSRLLMQYKFNQKNQICEIKTESAEMFTNDEMQGEVNYGSNTIAGHYLDVGDAKIYYEVYGEGKPILLLHGGMFGYISEYKKYIPVLSKNFKVIAIATRGHGKSELGKRALSYNLFAEDASKILKKESIERASLIGFSDGATTAYLFASNYPTLTNKIVSLAGGFGSNWFHKQALNSLRELTPDGLKQQYPNFVANRKKLMPKPEQWNKFITELNDLNMQPIFITDKAAKSINSPILIIGGDRDDYYRLDNFIHMYQTLPNSELAIIPKSGHVDLITKNFIFEDFVLPFIIKD